MASSERLCHAYRDLLASATGFEIVGLSTRYEARALALRHVPDLLIFALEPTELGELSALREIEAASPRTHVFFSNLSCQAIESLAPRGGAGAGLRTMPASAADLLAALRPPDPASSTAARPPAAATAIVHASDGPVYGGAANGNGAHGTGPLSSLTPREREVLRMAAEGMSSTETGRQLGISARTAECHRAHGMRKLGLHRRADLVRFAMTAGLVGGRTDLR